MRIHFVCTNNTFRSRIADTYLKSLNIPGLSVTSSGVLASNDNDGPVTWYAQRIFKNYGLIKSEKKVWDQTSSEDLKIQDLVIFMEKYHLDFCTQNLDFKGKYEVWNIADLEEKDLHHDEVVIEKSEKTFSLLKEKIGKLVKEISQMH